MNLTGCVSVVLLHGASVSLRCYNFAFLKYMGGIYIYGIRMYVHPLSKLQRALLWIRARSLLGHYLFVVERTNFVLLQHDLQLYAHSIVGLRIALGWRGMLSL
jgi:hypothetical protein